MSRSSSGSSRANVHVYLVMNIRKAFNRDITQKNTYKYSMLGTNVNSCPNHRNLLCIEESGNEAKSEHHVQVHQLSHISI